MATRAYYCPECGTEVPAGRLSCAACGTLLASVAGAARRPFVNTPGPAAAAGGASEPPGDAVDAAAASSRGARDTTARTAARSVALPVPPVLHDWTGPVPPTLAALAPEPAVAPERAVAHERAVAPSPIAPPAAALVPVAEPPFVPATVAPPLAAPAPAAPTLEVDVPSVSRSARAPAVDAMSENDFDSGSTPPEFGAEPEWPAPLPAVPGAYVAPTVVPTVVTTSTGRPATATTIAAAGVADGTVATVVPAPRPNRWFSVPSSAATPGKAGLFSDLPFRSPRGLAGWAVALGALLGAVAFVLPWSANGVVGTQNEQTYTGQWGLANPADLVPMLVALGLVILTLIPNRISAPTRGVVLPILIGGWLLGIAWSYATAKFGLGWGVDVVALAGLILVMGGAIGIRRAGAAGATSAKTDSDPA